MINAPSLLAVLSGKHSFANLITIYFDETTLRLASGDFNVNYNGAVYYSGILLDISEAKQTAQVNLNDLKIDLSSLNDEVIYHGYNQPWMNRHINWSRVYFNELGEQVGALSLFDGLLSKMSDSESGEFTFTASSEWADFNRVNGRKTNMESQHMLYPTDDCFEKTPFLDDSVPWGKDNNFGGAGGGQTGEPSYEEHEHLREQ